MNINKFISRLTIKVNWDFSIDVQIMFKKNADNTNVQHCIEEILGDLQPDEDRT